MEEFKRDLEQLLNKHSMEMFSGTPDFILAGFLVDALIAYNHAVTRRSIWYDESVIVNEEDSID